MDKRRLFYWFELLKITRSERIAISVVLIAIILFGMAQLLYKPSPAYDEEYYQPLQMLVQQKLDSLRNERIQKMARYYPDDADSLMEKGNEVKGKEREQENTGIERRFIVNINKAGINALKTLPGVGPVLAERILKYREMNGPFRAEKSLRNVKGIGQKRMNDLLPLIKITEH